MTRKAAEGRLALLWVLTRAAELLALMTVRAAVVGGCLGSVRRLLKGSRQEELAGFLEEWRAQIATVRSLAPPIAAAYLRDVTANLAP
jgi:hypothetical protein